MWRKGCFGISLQKRVCLCSTDSPAPAVHPVLTPCSSTAARDPAGDPNCRGKHMHLLLCPQVRVLRPPGHHGSHCCLLIRWCWCQCCHRSCLPCPSASPSPATHCHPQQDFPPAVSVLLWDVLPNQALTWLKNSSGEKKKCSGWEFIQLPPLLKSIYHEVVAPAKGWPLDCYPSVVVWDLKPGHSSHDSGICDHISRLKENKAFLWS